MSDIDKAIEQLRQAAKNIERALSNLDLREQECGECGTRHWANLTHARINQQFDDAPLRLRAAAQRLVETQTQLTASTVKEQ